MMLYDVPPILETILHIVVFACAFPVMMVVIV